jgi:hypothetical protein
MASTFKLFADKMGGGSAASYIGTQGEIFYDPSTGALRVSDGTTAGGRAVELAEASSSIPVTNQYFVDPARTDTYTSTGTILTPFKTITAAQTAIEAAITAGTITPAESNPVYIILTGNITENITMSRGHVFLVGFNSTIHAPIYFNGTITVSGSATGTGAIDSNHFSIQGLAISAPTQKAGIHFTGANAQRLFVKDLWLTARGNRTGDTPLTDAGGYGIYADCTGYRASPLSNSVIHGSDIKVSHTGTGDVYCFKIGQQAVAATVSADFANVETSGATQVGAVTSGCLLAFTGSELDANGEVCLESYGTGVLSVANSSITNAATGESYGVWLHTSGGAALITNTIIDVESSNSASRMVKGVAGTALFYKNVMIGRATTTPFAEHNKKIDSAVTAVAITTDSFTSV